MYRLLAFFLAFSCCAQDVKIIVAGQSNAVGYAPGTIAPDARVLAFDPTQNKFITAQESLPFWESIYPGFRGAWVQMGKLLLKKYDHVYLTGGGHGGEPISYWDDGQPGWIALKANILASGTDAQYFIWYQGENDSGTGIDYQSKLASLIARVRALTQPDLPVLIIELEDWAGFSDIRAAQYSYCTNDDHAFAIQTLGFPIQAASPPHLTSDGYDMLARVCAKQIMSAQWFIGPQGIQGQKGDKGDKGDTGQQGPAGIDGKDGAPWTPPPGMLIFMQHGSSEPDGGFGFLKTIRIQRYTLDLYQH